MHRRLTGLWRNADFVKLWTGQTISLLGSRVTMLALPLTAVSVLGATPAQMGILEAAGALPALLLGLFAGAWVDRHRRRPILIATDAGRAALLLLIPLATLAGMLHIEHLYVLAFLLSALGLAFGVAYGPFLLALVGRERIVEGNSKLQIGRSVAEVFGPGLAGGLMQLIAAGGEQVLSVTHLGVDLPADQIKGGSLLTVTLDVDLRSVSPGTYSGQVLFTSNSGEVLALPVTVNVRCGPIWPGMVLVIGVGLGLYLSTYQARGKLRDELTLRVVAARKAMEEDSWLKDSFGPRLNPLLDKAESAIRAEQWEEAKTAVQTADEMVRKWRRGPQAWLNLKIPRSCTIESWKLKLS